MITDQLDLLTPVPSRADVRSRTKAWLDRVRSEVLARFRGRVVSADDVRSIIDERAELAPPPGVHMNSLGKLFSDWPAAKPVGYTRSKRAGANRNLLRTWRIA